MEPKEVRSREVLKTIALTPPTLVQVASEQSKGEIGFSPDTPIGSMASVPTTSEQSRDSTLSSSGSMPAASPCKTFDSFVKIDPSVVDAWGIPILSIHYRRTDNDHHMLQHPFQQLMESMQSAGAKILKADESLNTPAEIIHEMGTSRMGNEAKSSALNKFNQAHDIKNLFVVHGGCWPSSA